MRLTDHAARRIRERGITQAQLEHAMHHLLGGPAPGSQPGTMVLTGLLPDGAGSIKIVVQAADRDTVITVWKV